MRIRIERDELRVYCLVDEGVEYGCECYVPIEIVKRWKRVYAQFEKIQEEMKASYDEACRIQESVRNRRRKS